VLTNVRLSFQGKGGGQEEKLGQCSIFLVFQPVLELVSAEQEVKGKYLSLIFREWQES